MTQRAGVVGELALRVLARGGTATVTRVFPSAAYIRSGNDFLLLLWGGLRSPMTINMPARTGKGVLRIGEKLELSERGLVASSASMTVEGAEVHRGELRKKRELVLPSSAQLARGVAMLSSMYDVSASEQTLPGDVEFGNFLGRSLAPYSNGKDGGIHSFGSYRRLIGRGGGFTPAGDDFVAGFVATFNFISRCRGTRQVNMPRGELISSTVPESGAIVAYSSRGYVDERMERLILASTVRTSGGYYNELLSVASRGHTSGVDMALGVLMCDATVAGRERSDGTLEKCIAPLRL